MISLALQEEILRIKPLLDQFMWMWWLRACNARGTLQLGFKKLAGVPSLRKEKEEHDMHTCVYKKANIVLNKRLYPLLCSEKCLITQRWESRAGDIDPKKNKESYELAGTQDCTVYNISLSRFHLGIGSVLGQEPLRPRAVKKKPYEGQGWLLAFTLRFHL